MCPSRRQIIDFIERLSPPDSDIDDPDIIAPQIREFVDRVIPPDDSGIDDANAIGPQVRAFADRVVPPDDGDAQ